VASLILDPLCASFFPFAFFFLSLSSLSNDPSLHLDGTALPIVSASENMRERLGLKRPISPEMDVSYALTPYTYSLLELPPELVKLLESEYAPFEIKGSPQTTRCSAQMYQRVFLYL
jgi:hypothetical protein